MKDKIYTITKKLSSVITSKDLNDIYRDFMSLVKKQSAYFDNFSTSDYIKFIFLLHSYNNYKNFELGESRLNNLFFFILIETDGELVEDECEDCSGSGSIECYDCDGTGELSCNECSGNGKIDCDECDGRGKIEDEYGDEVECKKCSGDGDIECEECDGNGNHECDDCDGSGSFSCNNCVDGYIKSDDYSYNCRNYCSWDKQLYSHLVDSFELVEPLKIDFINSVFNKNTSVLFLSKREKRNTSLLGKANKLYCSLLDDDPDLFKERNAIMFRSDLDEYLEKSD